MTTRIEDLAAELGAAAKTALPTRFVYCSGCAKRGKHTPVEPTRVIDRMPYGAERAREFYAWGCPDCIHAAEREMERRQHAAALDKRTVAGAERGLLRHPAAMGKVGI